MTTSLELPCIQRGKQLPGETFECLIHSRCTILPTFSQVRACVTCRDRVIEGQSLQPQEKLLGDWVEVCLTKVGITKELVTDWLGEECNCEERRQKLNQLHAWARRVFSGKMDKAKEHLEEMLT